MRRARPEIRFALVPLLFVGAGCWSGNVVSVATVRTEELASDPAVLAARAEELVRKGDPVSLENALIYLDKQRALQPGAFEPLWRSARAAYWVAAAAEHDKHRRANFANKGVEYARAAVAVESQRVEGHYYLGICLGFVAITKTIGALDILPDMLKEAELASELDEKFDHAGPRELVGQIYLKAPGWPTSIGDSDKAVEHLRRAIDLAPTFPPHHVAYGEALLEEEQYDAADKECDKALALLTPAVAGQLAASFDPVWAGSFPKWRAEAEALKKKIGDKR